MFKKIGWFLFSIKYSLGLAREGIDFITIGEVTDFITIGEEE